MSRIPRLVLPPIAAAVLLGAPPVTWADEGAETIGTVRDKTEGLDRREGLLTVYPDRGRGKVWLEVPPPGPGGLVGEMLLVEGLVTGLGSGAAGIDRGQLGDTRLVRLRRVGNRLLLEQPDLRYRALTGLEPEARAVEESFSPTVLWGGEIAAADPDGRALVDLTPLLLVDHHGIARSLRESGEGEFTVDPARSAVDLDALLVFPDNLEIEVVLTYSRSGPPPDGAGPDDVTVVQHISLIRPPDAGYRPRRFDPRAGSFFISFMDHTAPLGEEIERRWIVRHRLDPLPDPGGRWSVRRPIVYHVDPAIPEPVRSAVMDGAGWWAAAFEEAGFADAFRVELLPPGAHPLDVRYDVIQWVHRGRRSWSYGGGVIDPRTGEMVKGHVTLGSLRVRHDIHLFEALAGARRTGSGAADDPIRLSLARIRQLAAHEVGHTLGLAHNFAASTYAGRASVMDYPAPLIRPRPGGGLDFSEAYATGVGAWDRHAVRYAYAPAGPGGEEELLDRIVREGIRGGLLFLSDRDARGGSAAHPLANLWDNGADPVAELRAVVRVRRHALDRLGVDNVGRGRPLALLEERLALAYFHHRYQTDAAVKTLGGLHYAHSVAGDGQPSAAPARPAAQRGALEALLDCLDPEFLDLPDRILDVLLPRPFGYPDNPEMFSGRMRPVFDPLAAAEAGADHVLAGLLQPGRLARLVDLHRRDGAMPGAREVLERIVERVFATPPGETSRRAEIRRAVQSVLVGRLLALAGDDRSGPSVRARVEGALRRLRDRLADVEDEPDAARDHRLMLRSALERYLTRRDPDGPVRPPAPPLPPGSPIGDEWGCSGFGSP